MSEEVETTETRVTMLDVLNAMYVLEFMDDFQSPNGINDIQFQVGGKTSKGRLVNQVLVSMMKEGIIKSAGKRQYQLTKTAREVAEAFWDSRGDDPEEVDGIALDEAFASESEGDRVKAGSPSAGVALEKLKSKGLIEGSPKHGYIPTETGLVARQILTATPESVYPQ